MTSTFRLFAAVAVSVLALIAGAMRISEPPRLPDSADARTWQPVAMAGGAEVDELVTNIVEAGLFPNARLRGTSEAGAENLGIDEMEAAFVDPSVAALIKVDDEWTIRIHAEDDAFLTFRVNDILVDDWHISQITPTSVTFERNGETRRIDAFPTRNG